MEHSKLIITVFFLPQLIAVVDGRKCPLTLSNSTTNTEPDATIYDMTRYGHYVELDCCSLGRDLEVRWEKWNNTQGQWQHYDPDRSGVLFYDNRHVLSIESSMYADAGLYRCSVRNGSVMNGKRFHLDVVACDKLARGPYPVAPLPCQETLTQEKETLTLPCTGYFGCGESGDIRIVTWFVSRDKNKKDDLVEATSLDERYKQIDFERENGVVKGSNLTIEAVSDVDFNRKFMCLLASPQELHGQSRLFVTLRKDSYNSSVYSAAYEFKDIVVVVCIIAVISLLLNVVLSMMAICQRWKNSDKTVKSTSHQEWMPVVSENVETV